MIDDMQSISFIIVYIQQLGRNDLVGNTFYELMEMCDVIFYTNTATSLVPRLVLHQTC